MATPSAGPNISPVPAPVQQTLSSSYLDFSTGWAQQYLPELYEAEVERYGNRMLSGFLAKVGAEEAMASDQVVWSEQGRLHISIADVTCDASEDKLIFDDAAEANLVRKFDTVILTVATVSGGSGATQAVAGDQIKCIVTAVDVDSTPGSSANDAMACTVKPYTQASLTSTATGDITCNDNTTFTLLIYGSEHAKGTSLDRGALTPSFKSFTNKPIIIRDRFQVSGSDAAQIGWVEVTGEEGQSGYLWYLKAEGDTRARFNDYLEMSMLEAVEKVSGADALVPGGTEGMFAAIEDRGHIINDTFVASSGSSFGTNMSTIDNILTTLDAQGAIEENMLYLNRAQNINVDDTLGNIGAGYAAAAGFGVFDNSADMALNLGFSGFRRGSYDFYKSDFRYLNDKGTRGGLLDTVTNIRGVIVPAGTSTVYDGTLGKNLTRPFLHVRYRASQTDDRRLKTWVTGSVGAATSALDAMQLHFLTERCLITQGANNFMLMK